MFQVLKRKAPFGLVFFAIISASGSAQAEDIYAPSDISSEAKNDGDLPFVEAAISDTALQTIAGREDIQQQSTATQTAGVSRNSVGDNSVTGDARIADNAFQNLSGLSILNVNTGNNVAINAALNVNISIMPEPTRP